MKLNHLKAVVRKEFFHILRDPGSLFLVTIGPLLMIIVLVYMLTADVRNVPIAAIDEANNGASHDLLQALQAGGVVNVTERLTDATALNSLFDTNQVRAALIIPKGYGQLIGLLTGNLPQIQIIVDGTEPTSAERVLTAIYDTSDMEFRKLAATLGQIPGIDPAMLQGPVKISVERRYNPDLRSVVDFFPGLTAVVLSLPSMALALALTRERELGTMEQLVATPINRLALLMGKLVPYLAFGLVDVLLLIGVGRWGYDIPFQGSLLGYLLFSLFFLFSNMSLGLLISVLVRSQQVAVIVAFLVFFFPSFFLSGVFFPISAMPAIVQQELLMLPVTHYVTISKALYLQGTAIGALWFSGVALVALSVGIFLIDVALFRKKVL
ncbi:MAG: ABC transporter permease [Aggregatilineales bacterium]